MTYKKPHERNTVQENKDIMTMQKTDEHHKNQAHRHDTNL